MGSDRDLAGTWLPDSIKVGVSDLLKKSCPDANITSSILLPPDTHTA
jgi:hypothetical protein